MANLHLVWIRSSISHGRFSNASSSIARFNPMFQAKWTSTQNIYLKITSSLLSSSPQAWSAAKQLNHLCWFEIVPSHKHLVAAWCIFLWNPFDHAKSFLDWWNSGPGKCKHESDVELSIVTITDHSRWQLVHQSSTNEWPRDPFQTVQSSRFVQWLPLQRPDLHATLAWHKSAHSHSVVQRA